MEVPNLVRQVRVFILKQVSKATDISMAMCKTAVSSLH